MTSGGDAKRDRPNSANRTAGLAGIVRFDHVEPPLTLSIGATSDADASCDARWMPRITKCVVNVETLKLHISGQESSDVLRCRGEDGPAAQATRRA